MKIVIKDLFHEALKSFIVCTGDMIHEGELGRLRQSFQLMEELLLSGEPEVKNLIRSSYIPSLNVLLDECEWKDVIVSLLPHQLHQEFDRHMIRFEIHSDVYMFEIHLN